MISILKPGKDPALLSPYWPISLSDTISKLFEKILLNRILNEVSELGLVRDEQYGFQPRHSTSLQLAHYMDRITRNFGEKWLKGTVFLNVAKAFHAGWLPLKTNDPKFPILHGPNHLILPSGLDD